MESNTILRRNFLPWGLFSTKIWVFLSLLLIILKGADSFLAKHRKVLWTPSRGVRIFCNQDAKEIRCWKLHRINVDRPPLLSKTSLRDSTEQELETSPMTINGDLNGYFINGKSSNGARASHSDGVVVVDGVHSHSNGHSSAISNGESSKFVSLPLLDMSQIDVPTPTANGGFTHTKESRAKIGAANKGKTPWNKGRERSKEEKARIAAGVRARNREKFLQTLKDRGLTEEEFEEQKKEERRKKDAERRARRTEKGGYRPTEETKAKISKILKEKHARGEIKMRTLDPSKVRRGFTHSDETKRKISESLRKRWSGDPEYRERIKDKMKSVYSKEDIRKKVSATLKKKWKDPVFREEMLIKMNNNRSSPRVTEEYREKISRAMKKKWQDAEYRKKTLDAIAKHNESIGRKPKPRKPSAKPKGSSKSEVEIMRPLKPGATRLQQKQPVSKTKSMIASWKQNVSSEIKTSVKTTPGTPAKAATKAKPLATKTKVKKAVKKKKKKSTAAKEPDGSVHRLREERRDLFDLLYGDDEGKGGAADSPLTERLRSRFDFDDEDLDAFDPYGLDDY